MRTAALALALLLGREYPPRPSSATAIVTEATFAGMALAEGDSIATARPDGEIFGFAVIKNRADTAAFPAAFPIWGEEPVYSKLDGFADGEQITFLVFSHGGWYEAVASLDERSVCAELLYRDGCIWVVSLSADIELGITDGPLEDGYASHEVGVWPQPSRRFFVRVGSGEAEEVEMRLYDVLGRLVLRKRGMTNATQELVAPAAGVYVLEIRAGRFTERRLHVSP